MTRISSQDGKTGGTTKWSSTARARNSQQTDMILQLSKTTSRLDLAISTPPAFTQKRRTKTFVVHNVSPQRSEKTLNRLSTPLTVPSSHKQKHPDTLINSVFDTDGRDLLVETYGPEFKRRVAETSFNLQFPNHKTLPTQSCSPELKDQAQNKSIQLTESEEPKWHFTDPDEERKLEVKRLRSKKEIEKIQMQVRRQSATIEQELDKRQKLRRSETRKIICQSSKITIMLMKWGIQHYSET